MRLKMSNLQSTEGTDVQIQTNESSIQIPEGGRATFNVRLASRPSTSVTVKVARITGDSDITVVSGASLDFTTSSYNTWRTVTLAAADDSDATNGQATFRLTDRGWPSPSDRDGNR
jgi:hypothetical protein